MEKDLSIKDKVSDVVMDESGKTQNMEKDLSIKELSVSYGDKQVLYDVDLDIYKNKITSIIGPSGCGKTTLLHSLNNMIQKEGGKITKGHVMLGEEDITGIPDEDLRRRIGLVFQTPVPFPFSIYKNMTYALKYQGIRDKAELSRIVEEKLIMAGLYDEVKDELNKSALKLSGGQQQRLCIARALTVEPEVLLLDEPCSALDVKSTAIIEDMLNELKKRYTIVIVTHNLKQAYKISDYVAYIDGGKLVEFGNKTEIFENPKDERTSSFIRGW